MLTHIEFLGIPGSGKTYLLKKTAACLREHGKHALLLDEAVYQALKTNRRSRALTVCARILPYRLGRHFLTRFPRTADDVAYLAFQRFLQAHPTLAEMVLACHYHQARIAKYLDFLSLFWFFDLFSKYQLVAEEQRSENNLILYDEGFAQRAVTLFGYGDPPPSSFHSLDEAIARYIENIPPPRLIFVLTASAQSVESRMKARGYPIRMQSMLPQERERCLTQAAACIKIAVEQLRKYDVNVIEIDNNGTEADLLAQLRQALHAFAA